MDSTRRPNIRGVGYMPLWSTDHHGDCKEDGNDAGSAQRPSSSGSQLPYLCCISWAITLVMFIAYARGGNAASEPQLTYCESPSPVPLPLLSFLMLTSYPSAAPLEKALEYETKVFTLGFGSHTTKYQGSSPEVDAAWDELYDGTQVLTEHLSAAMRQCLTWKKLDPS